jgi:uncharacterized protein (TIGR01777 family)
MRVIILGANGFIGGHLRTALQARGDQVVTASLREPEAAAQAAHGCDAIVNLAGAPIAQRWNDRVKREIETSRTEQPRLFLDALAQQSLTAKTYISASAIGYYGTSETETFTESSHPGNDFLAQVCRKWEAQALQARYLSMRVACIRTALVLGSDGGALPKMLPPFKLGVGGKIGGGKQWYSWIHIDDLIDIYLFALDNANIDGPINASAPNPVTNALFTKTLGEVLDMPTILSVPAFVLRLMLGEGAVVLLEGQRVIPEKMQRPGYGFRFEKLKPALESLLQ